MKFQKIKSPFWKKFFKTFLSFKPLPKAFLLLAPHLTLLKLSYGLCFLSTFFQTYFQKYIGNFLDTIIQKKDAEELKNFLITMAVYLAILGLINRFLSGITQKTKNTLIRHLKSTVFSNILEKDMEFFDKNFPADIIQVINCATEELVNIATETLIKLFTNLTNIAIILILSNGISSKLATIMFLMIPSKAFIIYQTSKYNRDLVLTHQELDNKVNHIPNQVIKSINLIKSLSTEEKEIEIYTQKLDDAERLKNKIQYEPEAFKYIKDILDKVALTLLGWIGALMTIEGELTLGNLVVISIYFYIFLKSIDRMEQNIKKVIYSLTRCQNLFDMLEYEPAIKINEKQIKKQRYFEGDLLIKDVSFSYPVNPKEEVLKGINIEIKAGECVAICGPQSSGKQTLMNLILRHYDPRQGKIFIGQECIKEFDLSCYHKNIDYIPHEVTLLEGTLEENITYGVEGYDSEDLKRAIGLSNSGFIFDEKRFPEGLNTKLRTRCVQLSRGEKRSLLIARAILRKGKILILQESIMDFESVYWKPIKTLIEENLSKEFRTVILVANVVKSIECQRIYVLEKGRKVGEGTHRELIKENKAYKKLLEGDRRKAE